MIADPDPRWLARRHDPSSFRIAVRAFGMFLAFECALATLTPARAANAPIRFTNSPDSAAMRFAVRALRTSHPGDNIPLSEVSAALVNLVDGAPPQLFVQVAGDYCGSLGCSVALYEQGTTGWLIVNDWIIGSVDVSQHRTGQWHDLVLNHSVAWEHHGQRYVPAWPKVGEQ